MVNTRLSSHQSLTFRSVRSYNIQTAIAMHAEIWISIMVHDSMWSSMCLFDHAERYRARARVCVRLMQKQTTTITTRRISARFLLNSTSRCQDTLSSVLLNYAPYLLNDVTSLCIWTFGHSKVNGIINIKIYNNIYQQYFRTFLQPHYLTYISNDV